MREGCEVGPAEGDFGQVGVAEGDGFAMLPGGAEGAVEVDGGIVFEHPDKEAAEVVIEEGGAEGTGEPAAISLTLPWFEEIDGVEFSVEARVRLAEGAGADEADDFGVRFSGERETVGRWSHCVHFSVWVGTLRSARKEAGTTVR